MKVFISWSGSRSFETAKLLRSWLPKIVNDIEPWVSEEDLTKGGDWSGEITSELDCADFGIICVTPGNMERPWLLFEAGALSRQVGNVTSRVAPFLIGFESKSDLPRPLGRFQLTQPTKDDMLKLLRSLNSTCKLSVTDAQLSEAFDVWWPHFEVPYQAIEEKRNGAETPSRSERELLDEILQSVRSLQQREQPATPFRVFAGDAAEAARPPVDYVTRPWDQPIPAWAKISPAFMVTEDLEAAVRNKVERIGLKFVSYERDINGLHRVTIAGDDRVPYLHDQISRLKFELPFLVVTIVDE